MRFKSTGILLIVFFALLAYVYFVEIKGKEKAEKAKELASKLIQFEKDSLTTLVLEPNGIEFKKEDGKWMITRPIHSKTENWVINALVNSLHDAKKERVISSHPSSYADYGLEPAKRQIIFQHSGRTDTVYLGDKTPTGSFVFSRVGGDSTVYATHTLLLTNAEKELFDFRDKTVLSFEIDDIKDITLRTVRTKLRLQKEDDNWYILRKNGEKILADDSKVTSMLSRVRNAKAKKFVAEEFKGGLRYGLARPLYRLDLRTADDSGLRQLMIGSPVDGAYYAHDASRDPIFTVDSSVVHALKVTEWDLREKRLADFYSYQIDYLELHLPDSTFVCEKDTTGDWILIEPVRGKAKSWKVSSVAGSASSLRMTKVVDEHPANLKKYGLEEPKYHIICKKEGETLADIRIGKAENDHYYAVGNLSPAVVLVKKEDVEKFNISLKDLLEESEEEQSKE
ncbi:MAG: DUF4340 domain-containing protein [Calditrichaeota bacterium]|nr:MAG: DUF4340 domain-containing protein [Calditrichota bacterium]